MVGPGPDVEENEGPEVDDRKAVTEDRTVGGLRKVVVHDPQNRGREEEGDRIVSVPPLNQRILHAGEHGVAVDETVWDREVVDDIEDRDRHDGGDVEPDRDVQMLLVPLRQRPEEVDRKDEPDDGDGHVDRPDELGVLLSLSETERKRDRGGDDDQLPSPEVKGAESVAGEPRFHQALRRVVDAGEEHVAHERKDDRVRMEGSQAPKREPRWQIRLPSRELEGDHSAYQHAHDSEDHRRPNELSDDAVVVSDALGLHGFSSSFGGGARVRSGGATRLREGIERAGRGARGCPGAPSTPGAPPRQRRERGSQPGSESARPSVFPLAERPGGEDDRRDRARRHENRGEPRLHEAHHRKPDGAGVVGDRKAEVGSDDPTQPTCVREERPNRTKARMDEIEIASPGHEGAVDGRRARDQRGVGGEGVVDAIPDEQGVVLCAVGLQPIGLLLGGVFPDRVVQWNTQSTRDPIDFALTVATQDPRLEAAFL